MVVYVQTREYAEHSGNLISVPRGAMEGNQEYGRRR